MCIVDSLLDCEGDGYERSYCWARQGRWLVRGARKVHVGIAERLRQLATEAPGVEAPLPQELGITAEAVEEHRFQILEAVTEYHTWLESFEEAWSEVTLERVRAAARERLIDPDEDTVHVLIQVTLPGEPVVTLSTRSEVPFAQPWKVKLGNDTPRTVVSLEISRYVALLIDPDSPAAATLEGAAYWHRGFWADRDLWSDTFGEPWTKRYARQLCTEIYGWDDVSDAWRISDASIGHINSQPLSLQPDLVARGDPLVSMVRWWNHLDEDQDLAHDWGVFLDIHARVEAATARFPCLTKWKEAGPDRVLSLDAVGAQGHNETLARNFHDPVWRHSELAGSDLFEVLLRIEGDWVATMLLSPESDGAVVLEGHESLTGSDTVDSHPSDGTYVILRPDGSTEARTMPALGR